MDPRVAAILAQKQKAEQLKKNKEKEELLLDLDLYDKVYSPDGTCTDEYPYYDWDSEADTAKYYKKVPVEITDVEFEALKACTYDQNGEIHRNPVAITLSVIAWIIYICGFIAGLIVCNDDGLYGFILMCSAFISGTVFLAVAEIINQLFLLNKRMDKLEKTADTDASKGVE